MDLAPLQQAYKRLRLPGESTGGQYHGLKDDDEHSEDTVHAAKEATENTTQEDSTRRSWRSTLLIQIPIVLWLAPILALLYLNLHGHIIGASAWCPGGKCKFDVFQQTTSLSQKRLARYDRQDHNLLGVLQIVAKALEVWFVFIAGWLVFNLTVILAGRRSGLQLAYLTRPIEFVDIPAMFDPVLWRALPSRPSRNIGRAGGQRGTRWHVWAFVIFSVCLGIVCNLIGPAVAVLVIPSLQWLNTPKVGNDTFISIGAENPPRNNSFSFSQTDCSPEQVSEHQYSCAGWNVALDGWLQSCISQEFDTGTTSQEKVMFSLNTTDFVDLETDRKSDVITWAPNRQLLHSLSQDWDMLEQIGQGVEREHTDLPDLYDTYLPYENSVQTFIERNGPVLGAVANMWVGYNNHSHFDTKVDQERTLRCFQNYSLTHTPLFPNVRDGTFTKCVTLGKGWNNHFRRANFSIEGEFKPWLKNRLGPTIHFDIFTSYKAAFLPDGKVPDHFNPRCLTHGQIPEGTSCDWDLFFTPDPDLEIRSSKITTIQMTTDSAPFPQHPINVTFAVDFVTWFNFTKYSLDPGFITNPLTYVTTPDLPTHYATKVDVDPAWILTAYGVDAGGTLGANTSSTVALQNVLGGLWGAYVDLDVEDPISQNSPTIDCAAIIPVVHALSLVDYSTNISRPEERLRVDKHHPLLQRRARINVWAYAMSSRTAVFGVIITCIACVVVLLQTALAVKTRAKFYSPVQLLVAALEYRYSAEFVGMEHDEKSVARVPFRVEPVEHAASEFGFYKVD